MFRPTPQQLSMLEPTYLLPPSKRQRLEDSWAHDFRERVLPLIDEELLRDAFCENNGRPNTSIRLLMGLSLLKEMFDLTDDEALSHVEFNLQWQYALGLTPDQAHVSQRTLHSFRIRLIENDRASKMFDSLVLAMVRQEKIRVNSQRLDSTHVQSNLATVTRLTLFTETITHFLRDIKSHLPAKLDAIIPQFLAQYLDREGYFSDVKQVEARRRLPMVAQHLADLVRYFEVDPEVSGRDSFKLMRRLLDDQCDLTAEPPAAASAPDGAESPPSAGDGDTSPPSGSNVPAPASSPPVTPKPPKQISGSSLQSPYDADATYGHKGKGYQAQLSETCDPANAFQVVVGFKLTAANDSDQHEVIPMLDQLAKNGLAPDRIFADQGYGSGKNIVAADERGVDLHAPVGGVPRTPPRDPVPFEAPTADPTVNDGPKAAAASPTAASSSTQSSAASEDKNVAIGCADGAAESPGRESAAAATRRRQREQQTPAFREAYKIRSGIESTNRALKHRHGAGAMRVRGKARMDCALRLKTLAMNSARLVQHHAHRRRQARRTG